ncbi:hypothetical protein [Microcoleus sp. bin38.metabat.b11b12b14.051]|uniref:hypothetical protein n=1 Tax=Microcoleus sp. bin38.metabat.b11b12b14.051 TaxID=2742709 RepID=UPI0025E5AC89|nr:hypothetical protein [Microcoleus sp. bin38.metabat.b11b12b14.051]
MSVFQRIKFGTSVILTLATVAPSAAQMLAPMPAFAQTAFSDVNNNYWAKDFIQDFHKERI